ncbi:MAG: hypothetical protein IPN64_09905 [Propionivibrio sp.]|uniref:hypothetical protein n=1 Tax=Propionivibrio sp. TaxID=2212460 RepID=UPI0025D2B6C2|nr:hypothetical protein [Propionivibrio sp.]MBK8894356.1 hypothetical protein [Propionivibrio sp.]
MPAAYALAIVVHDAAQKLCHTPRTVRTAAPPAEKALFARVGTTATAGHRLRFGFRLVRPGDNGKIVVVGSHAALHAPDPRLALAVDACAAFFHDAGCRGEPEGISRLPVLDRRSIPTAAVDHRTARIGDARSMWESGVISFCNAAAVGVGWRCGMTVPEAVACYRATAISAAQRVCA